MAPPYQTKGPKPAPFTSSTPVTNKQPICGNTQEGGKTNKNGGVGQQLNKTFKPRKAK